MENEELTANLIEKILRDSLQSISKLESTVASQSKTIEQLTKERDELKEKLSGFDALLDTMNDQAKKEFDKLKADNFEKHREIESLKDEIQDLKDEMRVQSELNDPE